MKETQVRELFERVLADGPVSDVPAREDAARGRALRTRRRRRAGVVAASAAVAASVALVVVQTPWSEGAGDVASTSSGEDFSLPAEAADDDMLRAMLRAVTDALPDDVEPARSDGSVSVTEGSLDLWIGLDRVGNKFTVHVWMESTRPDLGHRSCEELRQVNQVFETCEEGQDGERWRTLARGDGTSPQMTLQGGTASVGVEWAADLEKSPSPLSESEVEVIADALWSVGNQRSSSELTSGVDLEATNEMWPEIRDELEQALGYGPLAPVGERKVDIVSTEWQTGELAETYETAVGETITLSIAQTDRMWTRRPLPRPASSDGTDGYWRGSDVSAPLTYLGMRGQLVIDVEGQDFDRRKVMETGDRISALIPYIR